MGACGDAPDPYGARMPSPNIGSTYGLRGSAFALSRVCLVVTLLACGSASEGGPDGVIDAKDGGDAALPISRDGGASIPDAGSDFGAELFVATDGADTNPGTLARPFATLERARTELASIKKGGGGPVGGVAITLRGGVYPRNAPFTLGADDSGTADRPVVWRSHANERARLVGGRLLDATKFSVVSATSPVWPRLDAAARGHVMSIDLEAQGITDFGTLQPRGMGPSAPAALELYFDRRPMQLARWPDPGESLAGGPAPIKDGFAAVGERLSDTAFRYAGDRPTRWGSAPEVWLHGYWKFPWADLHVRPSTIATSTRTITFGAVPGYGIASGQPYYAENLLEEITQPGEWYLERSTGILYFWPPTALPGHEAIVSTLDAPLVRLTGASFVRFSGVDLEVGRRELVDIQGGESGTFTGCRLLGAGTSAVNVVGKNHVVDHCEIAYPGDGGVHVAGGVRASLAAGSNIVRNNDIHHFGRFRWTYQAAVDVMGAGNVVAHNHVHDAPHVAILYSGNNHVIELNHIHDVLRYSSDAGAIYSGRDWGYRGNEIRHNFIHDLSTTFSGFGVHGIYLDDTLAGIHVHGNVLYRITGNGVLAGGGRDNVIENNLIVKCGVGLYADARGLTSGNAIPNDSGNFLQRLTRDGIRYQAPPWSTAYPALAAIPNDWSIIGAPNVHWRYPEGSVFSRNLGWANGRWIQESNYGGDGVLNHYAATADNVMNQDPKFVDESKLDLRLAPGSPALSIPGFQPIPFRSIGPEP